MRTWESASLTREPTPQRTCVRCLGSGRPRHRARAPSPSGRREGSRDVSPPRPATYCPRHARRSFESTRPSTSEGCVAGSHWTDDPPVSVRFERQHVLGHDDRRAGRYDHRSGRANGDERAASSGSAHRRRGDHRRDGRDERLHDHQGNQGGECPEGHSGDDQPDLGDCRGLPPARLRPRTEGGRRQDGQLRLHRDETGQFDLESHVTGNTLLVLVVVWPRPKRTAVHRRPGTRPSSGLERLPCRA